MPTEMTSSRPPHVDHLVTGSGAIRMFWHQGFYDRRAPLNMLRNLVTKGHLYTRTFNVGDDISPLVVGGLSGRAVRYTSPFRGRKLIAVGSVLDAARRGDVIWGAGIKHETNAQYLEYKRDVRVLAVRGPKTRAALQSRGIDCPEVYGDPAVLMPFIKPLELTEEFDLGIIPHKKQLTQFADHFEAIRAQLGPRVKLIDAGGSPSDYFDALRRCTLIASSTLHGLIFAEAYGIPAVLFRFGKFPANDPFKYEDYFESTGRSMRHIEADDLKDFDGVRRFAEQIPPGQIDLRSLLDAFPIPVEHPELKAALASGHSLARPTPVYGGNS